MNKNGSNRIRGRKLQEIRQRHFEQFPLCVECQKQGRITIATELDHIVALTNGGTDTDDNRQGLCTECHDAKTARDMGHRERLAISVDGWPESR
jgi:5-methylcytosine-specific restriction protein A